MLNIIMSLLIMGLVIIYNNCDIINSNKQLLLVLHCCDVYVVKCLKKGLHVPAMACWL